jgi:hypothetical protein
MRMLELRAGEDQIKELMRAMVGEAGSTCCCRCDTSGMEAQAHVDPLCCQSSTRHNIGIQIDANAGGCWDLHVLTSSAAVATHMAGARCTD